MKTMPSLVVAVLLAACAEDAPDIAVAADPLHESTYDYRVVELANDQLTAFDPVALTNTRRVYGTGYRCDDARCESSIWSVQNGEFRELYPQAIAHAANELGVVAGSVVTDPENVVEQAAIFFPGHVVVIPRLAGETVSYATAITNTGIAIVYSYDETSSRESWSTWWAGQRTELDLGGKRAAYLAINELGVISGTLLDSYSRGFRYNPYTRALTALEPVKGEPYAWALGISELGVVLGYSFGPSGERVGIWRPGAAFQTLLLEGTPAIPTVSNALLWNHAGLIVITRSNDLESYLLTDRRRKLRDAIREGELPVWNVIRSVNDRGDLLGWGGPTFANIETNFLLERIAPEP